MELSSDRIYEHVNALFVSLFSFLRTNESKSVHVTFTTRRETCPPVHINSVHLPQQDVKYLGVQLDRRLTWRKHIFTKRKQLGMTLTKTQWLLGRKSKLSMSNKILIHKAILKPIWMYGIQLWGAASTSNIEILECFQCKVLSMIVGAPRYVPNNVMHQQLKKKSVITALNTVRASVYTQTILAVNLMAQHDNRRLRRHLPNDLPTRYLL
jgi:hypothetical protein